jgi:hypothetical protein
MYLFLNNCVLYVRDERHACVLLKGNGDTEDQDCLVRLASAYELWDLIRDADPAGPVMWTLVSKGTKVLENGDLEIPPLQGVPELEKHGWWKIEKGEGVTAEGQPYAPGAPHYPASVHVLPEFDRAHVQQVVQQYTEVLLKRIAESFAALVDDGTITVEQSPLTVS